MSSSNYSCRDEIDDNPDWEDGWKDDEYEDRNYDDYHNWEDDEEDDWNNQCYREYEDANEWNDVCYPDEFDPMNQGYCP